MEDRGSTSSIIYHRSSTILLELHHRRTPGKPSAEGIKEHDVPWLNSPLAFGLIQSDGNRGRRSIAVSIDIHHHLFHPDAKPFGERNDDPAIGLMGNHQRYLFDIDICLSQCLSADLLHRAHGDLEDFF